MTCKFRNKKDPTYCNKEDEECNMREGDDARCPYFEEIVEINYE